MANKHNEKNHDSLSDQELADVSGGNTNQLWGDYFIVDVETTSSSTRTTATDKEIDPASDTREG